MKKKILLSLGFLLLVFVGFIAYTLLTTKKHSPAAEAALSYEGTEIKVNYCQPYKKERMIFGEESAGALLPYGKYWRLGANEATEISFSTDVNFGGAKITAGKYRMYAVPGKDSWEVSLNSQLGEWGAFEPDYTKDVLKVQAQTAMADSALEQFTIGFSSDSTGAQITFAWDKTVASIPITK